MARTKSSTGPSRKSTPPAASASTAGAKKRSSVAPSERPSAAPKAKRSRAPAAKRSGNGVNPKAALRWPSHDAIAARAYELYVQSGCEDGRADEHWYQAERELNEAN